MSAPAPSTDRPAAADPPAARTWRQPLGVLGSVRSRLLILVLALILPAVGVSAYLLRASYEDARQTAERQLLETARALSLVMDRQIGQSRVLLQALAAVLPADDRHLQDFYVAAQRATAGTGSWAVLTEADGHQLLNSRYPWGAPVPQAAAATAQVIHWTPIEGGPAAISTLFMGGRLPQPLVAVRSPVPGPGGRLRYLAVAMLAASLEQIMADQGLPEHWIGSIIDHDGRLVARSFHGKAEIGSPVGGRLAQMIRTDNAGVLHTVSLEDLPLVAAFSRSHVSGWSFVVAMPERELSQAVDRSVALGIGSAIMILSLGVALTAWVGRGIVRPIERLAGGALSLARGDRLDIRPGGLIEADIAARALNFASQELHRREGALRQSQERLELAVRAHGIGIFDWDLTSGDVVWSEQEERLFGLPPGSFRGDLSLWIGAVLPEDRERLRLRLAGAREQRQELVDFDFRIRRPDGEVRWLDGSGRFLYGPDGSALRMIGLNYDVTERRRAEDARALLAREVDHRAKNALAVVQSLVRLTPLDTPERFAAAVEGRIGALARAHALLAAQRWTGAGLRVILQQELAPFIGAGSGRVVVSGPEIRLTADAVQPVSLILHELVTNAAKHGALSLPGGRLTVSWRPGEGSEPALLLEWRETDGPPSGLAERRGFGTTLIEASSHQLSGQAVMERQPFGLIWRIELPSGQYAPVAAADERAPGEGTAGVQPDLVGLTVLAVEDNAVTAMAMEADLRALGCQVTVSGTLDDAACQARSRRFDAAILDVDVAGQPIFPVADALRADGVPIVFATGFSSLSPEGDWDTVPVLEKPYTRADLARTLGELVRRPARGSVTGR
jgi:PAS domain S-box-containing protein